MNSQVYSFRDDDTVLDSLNGALFSIEIVPDETVVAPQDNQLIIYVEDFPQGNNYNRKTYIYDLPTQLACNDNYDNYFTQEIVIENNKPIVKTRLYYNTLNDSGYYELDPQEIILFEGYNRIYTNYQNVDITINYLKDNFTNRYYSSNALFNSHLENSSSDFSLDDIYFKDAFTKTGNELNEEIDNLNVKCITSKNNNFSLDSQGNIIVNSITTNSTNGLLDLVYPVGSIYMTVNSTSPATLFGGNWEQIESDAYLKIVNTNAGNLGGTSSNHKIPLSSIPSHNHYISSMRNCGVSQGGFYGVACNNSAGAIGMTTDNRGGSEAYYPYYFGVYVWKRIS